jgi:hypothetical protein
MFIWLIRRFSQRAQEVSAHEALPLGDHIGFAVWPITFDPVDIRTAFANEAIHAIGVWGIRLELRKSPLANVRAKISSGLFVKPKMCLKVNLAQEGD